MLRAGKNAPWLDVGALRHTLHHVGIDLGPFPQAHRAAHLGRQRIVERAVFGAQRVIEQRFQFNTQPALAAAGPGIACGPMHGGIIVAWQAAKAQGVLHERGVAVTQKAAVRHHVGRGFRHLQPGLQRARVHAGRARRRELGRQPQHHAQRIGFVLQVAVVFIFDHQLVAQHADAHPVQAGGAHRAGQAV